MSLRDESSGEGCCGSIAMAERVVGSIDGAEREGSGAARGACQGRMRGDGNVFLGRQPCSSALAHPNKLV